MRMLTNVDIRSVGTPAAGALCYTVLIVLLGCITVSSIKDILDRQQDVSHAAKLLEKFEHKTRPSRYPVGSVSPFLEGATITVATASLLQRVAIAVTRFGGNVVSSQVETVSGQNNAEFINVVVASEIGQSDLQALLYDLEAGSPLLFIDRLTIQAGDARSATTGNKRLQVTLGVSGRWQASK